MEARRLTSHTAVGLVAVCLACAARSQDHQSPIPEGAAVIVMLRPPRNLLTIECAERTMSRHAVDRVTGRVRSLGADTIQLAVASVGTAGGGEEQAGADCVVSLRRDSSLLVVVLSRSPGSVETRIGIGALVASLSLLLLLAVLGATAGPG